LVRGRLARPQISAHRRATPREQRRSQVREFMSISVNGLTRYGHHGFARVGMRDFDQPRSAVA
jgi:hypothetical protein